MTTTIKIYGASDDLIEVEGAAKGCDEYGAERGHIVLEPSGDRFHVEYGADGRPVWSVTHADVSGLLSVSIERAPEDDDPDPYTDTATIEGDVQRVRFWRRWPATRREIEARVEDALDGLEPHRMDEAALRALWAALGEP